MVDKIISVFERTLLTGITDPFLVVNSNIISILV